MNTAAQRAGQAAGVLTKPRILVAEPQPELLRHYAAMLDHAGYHVETSVDGPAAIAQMHAGDFAAVICDVSLPGNGGLDLLRAVRAHDLDVPVVLMTPGPAVQTAVTALEHGALRYLIKPIEAAQLIEVVGQAVLLHRMAKAKREALMVLGNDNVQPGDKAGADARFTSALDSLWMAYQPIISWQNRRVHGFEALVRGTEPSLPHPNALIDAAERLDRLQDLSRAIRAQVAADIRHAPEHVDIYVNLHTHDLLDDELFSPNAPLSAFAKRIILEITERTALDEVQDVPRRIGVLRALGYRIAIDDLGAGYAGLATFAQLEPDVVKLDMSLVRDINTTPTKRKLMKTMVNLCQELGMAVIAEGIETLEERDTLQSLGCDLMQGFLFALPERGFQTVILKP
jgi:EAL domain-containing protein (putative c-di-GMP-specific phosphodiesterase class I)/CheY-like chemotaxis protein